ncbi:hypothetical protein Ddye_027351 [Dipteronia dyeriana]|uniref:Uncharacterized protein n=1 Tax=Dipteronia dyeriana TaxID=168575 RepID=A0AAD9WQE6_9ROSI|nr:hypothetical protein Ddye_027351 [Dipteronia dyeriana]
MEKSSNSMNNNNSMSRRRAVFSNNNNNERMLLSSSGVSGDHDHQDQEQEESGWTMYFDDFFNEYNNNHDDDQKTSSMISIGDHHDHLESSIISDAASSAAKKFAHHDQQQQVMGFPLDKTCYRSSSFKKRKTKIVLLDEDLRDTATSPANSPKVFDLMNQFDRKQQQKNIMDKSKERGSASRNVQIDEFRSGFGSINDDDNNGRGNDTSELKKKGLCLVPLSMIVNYLD